MEFKLKIGHHNKDCCGYVELLSELVENPDNKIVVFSQWKKMFELVIEDLKRLGLSYVYLNGDVPAREHNQIITRFQKEKDLRVFLSTDVEGVGVNLQSANCELVRGAQLFLNTPSHNLALLTCECICRGEKSFVNNLGS